MAICRVGVIDLLENLAARSAVVLSMLSHTAIPHKRIRRLLNTDCEMTIRFSGPVGVVPAISQLTFRISLESLNFKNLVPRRVNDLDYRTISLISRDFIA